MTRIFAFVFLAGAFLTLSVNNSSAATACPQGMTASGKCVNPKLARLMRDRVLAFSQPKFSYTAPANLPSEDGKSGDIPVHWYELNNLHYFPPATGTPATVCIGLTRGC